MIESSVVDRLKSLRLGDILRHKSLRFVPLLGNSSDLPAYRLFGREAKPPKDSPEASPRSGLEITEVSEGGQVPKLRVCNKSGNRVLLVDGQELVGAKQNRMLNVDVLVPVGATLDIPVTCVEAQRWGSISKFMMAGKSAHRSSKEAKMKSITSSLKTGAGYRSDQQLSWEHDRALLDASRTQSPSRRLSDAYVSHGPKLSDIRGKLTLPGNSIGVAVYDGDRFLGLGVFDKASTLSETWENLVDSYLMDYLAFGSAETCVTAVADATEAGAESDPIVNVQPLLEKLVSAEWDTFPPPGEGKDIRFESKDMVAAALVWEDRQVVHLQAYPKQSTFSYRSPAASPSTSA